MSKYVLIFNSKVQNMAIFVFPYFPISQFLYLNFFISRRALAREGDYEMMSVCACVRALVSHADFSKTATATDFL